MRNLILAFGIFILVSQAGHTVQGQATQPGPQRLGGFPRQAQPAGTQRQAGPNALLAAGASFKVGKLKYGGGGDWYANPTSLPNLFAFIRQNTRMNLSLQEEVVEPGSPNLFNYPMVYMTGHGNVAFSDAEARNLRTYIESGGFLLADDNYGMYQFVVRELKRMFPDYPLVEVPFSHPVFHQHWSFPNGLPKVHEHDGKPAQGFGIFINGRLAVFVTYQTDLGDGWEDRAVHPNPEELREKALKMGANIVQYVVSN